MSEKLPKGWISTELGKLLNDISYGYTAKATTDIVGPKLLRITDLQNGRVNWEIVPYCKCNNIDKYKLEKGDIVVARTGATTGKSYLLESLPFHAVYASYLIRLKPYNQTIGNYIQKFMISTRYWEQIQIVSKGIAQPGANASILSKLQLPLPPLPEQKRIAAKLNSLLAKVDACKARLDKVSEIIRRFRQSVLAVATSGKLTEDWREENSDSESAEELLRKIQMERRAYWEKEQMEKFKANGKLPKNDKWKAKYKEPISLEVKKLDEITKGWAWSNFDTISGKITDGEHVTPKKENSGVFLLSARNVLNGKLNFDKVDYISEKTYRNIARRIEVTEDDVLMSCSGTVGRTCTLPKDFKCAFVRSVAIIKPFFGMGEFISISIRSSYLQKQIDENKTQTAQANIFQGKIKALKIILPPLNEQKEIVRRVEALFSKADQLQEKLNAAKSGVDKLTASILAKAFRGELVPRDPNDEPAELLLQRIRAEQEAHAAKPKKGRQRRKKRT
ncbi:restriction endonuclease subunit S [Desulfobacterales bacterium HSG2]|nr:restriction endonuclease subunit S [Desulfobacterales bacterium HSG2]